jgi:hypothetical protein
MLARCGREGECGARCRAGRGGGYDLALWVCDRTAARDLEYRSSFDTSQ